MGKIFNILLLVILIGALGWYIYDGITEMRKEPMYPGDTIFRSAGDPEDDDWGQRRRWMTFEEIDANRDGKISEEEAPGRMGEFFAAIDTNGDGGIDADELETRREMRRRQRARERGDDDDGRETRENFRPEMEITEQSSGVTQPADASSNTQDQARAAVPADSPAAAESVKAAGNNSPASHDDSGRHE